MPRCLYANAYDTFPTQYVCNDHCNHRDLYHFQISVIPGPIIFPRGHTHTYPTVISFFSTNHDGKYAIYLHVDRCLFNPFRKNHISLSFPDQEIHNDWGLNLLALFTAIGHHMIVKKACTIFAVLTFDNITDILWKNDWAWPFLFLWDSKLIIHFTIISNYHKFYFINQTINHCCKTCKCIFRFFAKAQFGANSHLPPIFGVNFSQCLIRCLDFFHQYLIYNNDVDLGHTQSQLLDPRNNNLRHKLSAKTLDTFGDCTVPCFPFFHASQMENHGDRWSILADHYYYWIHLDIV